MKLDKLLDRVSVLSDNSSIQEGREQMTDNVANEILHFAEVHLNYYIEDLEETQDHSTARLGGGPAPVRSGVLKVERNFKHYGSGDVYPTVIPVILKIGTAHKDALEMSRKFETQLINDIAKSFDVEQTREGVFITDHSTIRVASDYASAFASVKVIVHPR